MSPPRLSPGEAYEAIQRILDTSGSIVWTDHARRRARERQFTAQDVLQVLRHGSVGPSPEWDGQYQSWKYRIAGRDLDHVPLTLVLAIDESTQAIVLITGHDD